MLSAPVVCYWLRFHHWLLIYLCCSSCDLTVHILKQGPLGLLSPCGDFNFETQSSLRSEEKASKGIAPELCIIWGRCNETNQHLLYYELAENNDLFRCISLHITDNCVLANPLSPLTDENVTSWQFFHDLVCDVLLQNGHKTVLYFFGRLTGSQKVSSLASSRSSFFVIQG